MYQLFSLLATWYNCSMSWHGFIWFPSPPLVVKLSAATPERDKNVRSVKKVENSCEQKMDNTTKTSMLTCELNYAPSIHCGKRALYFCGFYRTHSRFFMIAFMACSCAKMRMKTTPFFCVGLFVNFYIFLQKKWKINHRVRLCLISWTLRSLIS